MTLDDWIKRHKQVELVRRMNKAGYSISQAAITQWRDPKTGLYSRVPELRWLQVEKVTGGEVTETELRAACQPVGDAA